MLDLRFIREHVSEVEKALKNRGPIFLLMNLSPRTLNAAGLWQK